LLGEDERVLFRRLGVFAGGFDLKAVAAAWTVPGPREGDILTGLALLVDQNLVRQDPGAAGGMGRFALLETIREYAAERLAEGDDARAVREAHAAHFLAWAEAAEPHLRGPEQVRWFVRLQNDHANLRQALCWYHDEADLVRALRLAGALGRFWEAHGHVPEGRALLGELLASAETTGDVGPAVLAKALGWAGTLSWVQGDFAVARARHEEALARYA
jgi:predicted ATPase